MSTAELDQVLTSPRRKVRFLPPRLARLAVEGARRSPTFTRLLLELQPGDVIVHVSPAPLLPPSLPARTVLAAAIGNFRFVRIELGDQRMGDDLIAVLGHELFHALEIAEASDVRSGEAIHQLYRRIGFRGANATDFDTDAARIIERRIRAELASPR